MQGLAACGYRAELLELLVPLEQRLGTDKSLREAVRGVWKDANESKTDATKWCLAANGAMALNEYNDALIACYKAREIQPDHPIACQMEAGIWIRNGNFLAAREALLPLGEHARRTQPGIVQLNARVTAETLWILIDDEYKAVLEAQSQLKSKTTKPMAEFLYGVLTATPTEERAEWVAKRATGVSPDDPNASLIRRIRVEATYRLAELSVTTNPKGGPPQWNLERVNATVRAIEALTPDERSEPAVAAAIATLQLKGLGNAPLAMRSAGALRAVESSLSPRQLEVLGEVLTANGKPNEAILILERAVKMARPNAGLRIALARAYLKNNQVVNAREEIGRAEDTPNRSGREQAELVEVKQLLIRENS
jgi:Flp pilus assembly protein TadD